MRFSRPQSICDPLHQNTGGLHAKKFLSHNNDFVRRTCFDGVGHIFLHIPLGREKKGTSGKEIISMLFMFETLSVSFYNNWAFVQFRTTTSLWIHKIQIDKNQTKGKIIQSIPTDSLQSIFQCTFGADNKRNAYIILNVATCSL